MAALTRARVVVVDQWPLATQPWQCDSTREKEGELVFPDVDENGICSFDLPVEDARRLVANVSHRFRLYKTPPISAPVNNPNGSIEWRMFNPWYYLRCTKDVKGEVKWVTEWHEQTEPPWDKTPVRMSQPAPTVLVTTVRATPAATVAAESTTTTVAAPVETADDTEEDGIPRMATKPVKNPVMEIRRTAIEDAILRLGNKERVHAAVQEFVSGTGKKSIALLNKEQHFEFLDLMKNLE